jgi:hypothetical protein
MEQPAGCVKQINNDSGTALFRGVDRRPSLQRFGLSSSLEGVSAALLNERIKSVQNSIRFCKR